MRLLLDTHMALWAIADAPGSFHTHILPDDPSHQGHVGNRGAARPEACRCLDEVRAGRFCERAGRDLLLVREVGRFDDHLACDTGGSAWRRHGFDVALDGSQVAGLQRPDVDHHVHFARAVEDHALRFESLHVRQRGAEREPND